MTALLLILAIVAALGALGVLSAALARRVFHTVAPWDETHRAPTADGLMIAVHRYRGPVTPDRPPVVLCHGIAANHRNLDLDADHSLARHLAQTGRDVWVVDLRGVGASDRPRRGFTFDDHARHDLPAVLAAIAAATGATACDWVGYSMGGLVAYAGFGGGAPLPLRLRRLVTIGSPVVTRARSARDHGLVGLLAPVARRVSTLRLAGLAQATAWLGPALNRLTGGAVGVPRTTARRQVCAAMVDVVANIEGGVTGQFRRWMDSGRFDSNDGTCDYGAHMAMIEAPALVVGGLKDRVAPPRAVTRGFDLLGGTKKRLLLLGRAAGQRDDYGHMDLAFGRNAAAEVFGEVAQFLNADEG